MLESFSLADKRQVQHNKRGWDTHTVVTHRKNPSHVILNLDLLEKEGEERYLEIVREIWAFTCQ